MSFLGTRARAVLTLALLVGLPTAATAQTVLLESGHYHSNFSGALFQSILSSLNARSTNGGSGTLFLFGNSSAGAGVTNTTTLSGQTLSNYNVLEVNLENNTSSLVGYESLIQSFLSGGGSLGVTGLAAPAWAAQLNSILGFDVAASVVRGNCSDANVTTADGIAFGLSSVNPNVSCYEHGSFNMAALPSGYQALRTSGERLNGATIVALDVTATPEPASLGLLATGLLGIAGMVRRKRTSRDAA